VLVPSQQRDGAGEITWLGSSSRLDQNSFCSFCLFHNVFGMDEGHGERPSGGQW
jgi:hypothetical protein